LQQPQAWLLHAKDENGCRRGVDEMGIVLRATTAIVSQPGQSLLAGNVGPGDSHWKIDRWPLQPIGVIICRHPKLPEAIV
jgi:hypothetical protein